MDNTLDVLLRHEENNLKEEIKILSMFDLYSRKGYLEMESKILESYKKVKKIQELDSKQKADIISVPLSQSLFSPKSNTLQNKLYEFYRNTSKSSSSLSEELVKARSGEGLNSRPSPLSSQEIRDLSKDGYDRVLSSEARTKDTLKRVIEKGIKAGWSESKIKQNLRAAYKQHNNSFERIIKTESTIVTNKTLSNNFKRSDIKYVQRVTQNDSRVCEFCAARSGKVYPIDKAPTSIHPRDRCYNIPWSIGWDIEGRIDNRSIQKQVKEGRNKNTNGVNYGLTPFEKNIGATESPKGFDPSINGFSTIPFKDRESYEQTVRQKLFNVKDPNVDHPYHRQLWSLFQGALFTGLTLGAYAVVRARYRANLDNSALEAQQLAQSQQFDYLKISNYHQYLGKDTLLNTPKSDQALFNKEYQQKMNPQYIKNSSGAVFVAGGFGGKQGFSSLEVRNSIAKTPALRNHILIDTPNQDFDIPIGMEQLAAQYSSLGPLSGAIAGALTAKNMAVTMMSTAINGKNPTAIRMAAQALDFHAKHPDKPISLVGYSGGGLAAKEAAILLNKLGLRVNVVSIGSPDFGLFNETDFYANQHTGLTGTGDFVAFAGGPPINHTEVKGTPGHFFPQYANNPVFHSLLETAVMHGKPKQTNAQWEQAKQTWNNFRREINTGFDFTLDSRMNNGMTHSQNANVSMINALYREGVESMQSGQQINPKIYDKIFNPKSSSIDQILISAVDRVKYTAQDLLSPQKNTIDSIGLSELIDKISKESPTLIKSILTYGESSLKQYRQSFVSDLKNTGVQNPTSVWEQLETFLVDIAKEAKSRLNIPIASYPPELN